MKRHHSTVAVHGFIVFSLILLLQAAAFAQSEVPAGGDIPTQISSGKYELYLLGSATWTTPVYINSAARSALYIDGRGNVVTLPANSTSMLRDFTVNNTTTIINTTFRPSTAYPNMNDYLIGAVTAGITTNLHFEGTTFDGFSGLGARGGTILYAYGLNSTINVYGGDAGLVFRNNRGQSDAAGAVAVAFSTLNFHGDVTFDSNWTGDYGGAVVAYDYNNLLTFNGVTNFVNNHAVVFGGGLDVWGGQATVVFNKETNFDGNYVYYNQDVNDYDSPTHINDQHARGGAINIGYVATLGNGASVTFNDLVTFTNNYVVSTGTRAANRNALGGAVSVYGNGLAQNYRLIFNKGALFEGNYVYATTGTGNGGAIYYDSAASQLSLASGTKFLNNYAKTYGGAIYLQSGIINLNATTDDIVFQGNRHGVSFDAAYKPIAGTGTPNAIYLGTGGTLNLDAAAGYEISFYDPIASVAGSSVIVNKTGGGEVVFYGDGTTSGQYDSAIQASTNILGGYFTLADGVKYGSTSAGTFSVANGGVARGGGDAALLAKTVTVGGGGTLGVVNGVFTVDSPSITMQGGSMLAGNGTLAATSNINIQGTVTARVENAETLNITGNLAGTGGLAKTGDGTLVLSTANAYTGATAISGGTLAGGTDNAFAQSSAVTVASGGVLDTGGYNQVASNLGGAGDAVLSGNGILTAKMAADATLSGTISGSGGLLKTGGATLTLSGDNAYTGGTTIAAGQVTATRGTALGLEGVAIGDGAKLALAFGGDETMANLLSGAGTVIKSGSGTAHLTGIGSSVGAVEVADGILSLEQNGAFTAKTYTTAAGATTSLSAESTLAVGGTFTQASGSTLNVAVGDSQPAIAADAAQLGGDLYITGFSTSSASSRASRFNGTAYTVIATANGIAGDFDSYHIGEAGDLADYLTITGGIVNGGKDYAITFGLAWFAGPVAGNGVFTLGEPTDIFNVDVALSDQDPSTVPWSGRDLTKMGGGTLILSAQNTYTGFTDIQAGTLLTAVENAFEQSESVRVAAGAELALDGNNQIARNLSGDGDITLGGAVLTVKNDADTSFAGDIAGSGSLTKSGSGTLTLSGTNTHDAGTAIEEGTLQADAATALGAGAIGIGDAGTLNLHFSADETLDNRIGGTGALVAAGTETTTLTASGSSAGSVAVESGTLAFAQSGAFSTVGDYTTMGGAATTIGENSTLDIGTAFTQQANSTLNVAVGADNEPAITAANAALDGTLDITGFGPDVLRRADAVPGKTYVVIETSGGIAGDFDEVILGTVGDPVDYVTVAGSKSSDGNSYFIYFGLTWFAGDTLGNGDFTLADASDIFDVNVVLSDQAASSTGWDGEDLTKKGDGTLVLSRQNTYTGSTDIEGGTLRTDVANAFASSSDVSVASGATLDLNGNNQIAANLTGAGAIRLGAAELTLANGENTEFSGTISGAGSLAKTGGGDLALSGSNAYQGGTSVAEGRLIAENGSALGTGTADIKSGAALELAFADDASFANKLSGSGLLEKTGNGVASLTAAGSSVGTALVSAGTLSLEQAGAFQVAGAYATASGAETTIQSQSTLEAGTTFTQEAGAVLNVAIGPNNDPAITAASAGIDGVLNVTGLASLSRASDAAGQTFTVISTSGGIAGDFDSVNIDAVSSVDYLTVAGRITDDGNSYVVGMGLTWFAGPALGDGVFTLTNASDTFTVDVALSDQAASATGWDGMTLTKEGDGTLVLSGQNTYTGDTIVNAGALVAGADDAIAASGAVTVNANGALALGGSVQTIQNLSGTGSIALGDAALTVSNATNTTFSGTIDGNGSVTKTGAADLTLSGINSYEGGTTVSEGNLIATNASALGFGAVGLDSNGTLILDFAADEEFVNGLSGTGTLVKTGIGIATFTAAGSSAGDVLVENGELFLNQSGIFTAGSYTTAAGATTAIGGGAQLVATTFVQDSGATLSVDVGQANDPAVSAVDATLAGTLNVSGFSGGAYGKATDLLTAGRYTVVAASGSLSGTFSDITIGGAVSTVDYLVVGPFQDANSFQIGFGLKWQAGAGESSGTFTLDEGEAFEVDVVLGDETAWAGWDGASLTKQGEGTLILSEQNTYTGATDILAGTLNATAADAFAQSSSVSIASGATLALGADQTANSLTGAGSIELGSFTLTANNIGAGDSTFSGTITGNGGLEKTGAGELTLSGSNAYAGGTTIADGVLAATTGGALGAGTATINAAGTLRLDFADDQTFVNQLAGTGDLIKAGAGTAHLTATGSQAGSVTVSGGELSFEEAGAFTAQSYTTETDATTSVGEGATLAIGGSFTQQSGSTLNIDIHTDGSSSITADAVTLAGTLNITGFSGGRLTSTDDLTGERIAVISSNSAIVDDFDSVTIGTATADPVDYLTVTGYKEDTNYYVGFGLTWFAGSEKGDGVFTISASTDEFTVNTVLSDEDGKAPFDSGWSGTDLTKNGEGTLILASENTYTGYTEVNAGTVRLTAIDAIAASTSAVIAAGARLDMEEANQTLQNLAGAGTVLLGDKRLTAANSAASEFSGVMEGSGSLVKTGAERLTLSGENAYTGGTTISEGTLVAGNGSALGSGTATVENSAILELNFQGTMANTIAGDGGLVKSGGGTTSLTATDSEIGSVEVSAGNLSFEQTGEFGVTGDYTTGSGAATSIGPESTLRIGGAFTQTDSTSTLNVAIGDANQPTIKADSATLAGTLNISGFQFIQATKASDLIANQFVVVESMNSINGDFDDVILTSRGSTVDYLVVGGIKDDREYRVGFALAWQSGPTTGHGTFNLASPDDIFEVDVVLEDKDAQAPFDSGWNGKDLAKEGEGTLILSEQNTYTGATLVSVGTLQTDVANAFADSSSVTVAENAVLALNGNSQIANNLSGAGSITLGDNASTVLTERNDTDTEFSGTITGTGALRKGGSGELLLSGRNTYDQGTEINKGSIVATNGSALGTGAVDMKTDTSLELRFAGNETVSNQLTGSGDIVKTDIGAAHLTGENSTVNSVTVEEGGLYLEQDGVFTAGTFTTESGATAGIGAAATLAVEGTLTQASGSSLNVAIGASPTITAGGANLAGTLNISGFSASLPAKASAVTEGRHIVIQTTDSEIDGDFDMAGFGDAASGVDYLVVDGHVDDGGYSYSVGFALAWYVNGNAAHGTFTLTNETDAFDVDVALNDRTDSFPPTWNGKDLTKNGEGTLTLSAENAYSGATAVNGGTLAVKGEGTLGKTSSLYIASGASALLDSSRDQSVGLLTAASGSTLAIARGTLTITDDQREAGAPSRSSLQADTLAGAGTLALDSSDLDVSGANSGFTGDVAASGGSAIVMDNAAGLGQGGGLELDGASDSLTFNGAGGSSGTQTFGKSLSGAGLVAVRSGSDIALAGNNSAFSGNFTIDAGSTLRAGAASHLGSADIVDDGNLVLSSASAWKFENAATGSGTVTKDGPGQVLVENALSGFDGRVVVAEGAFIVGDASSTSAVLGGAGVSVAPGGILSGAGTVGDVVNAGTVASLNSLPGYENAPATNFTIGRLNNSGIINLAGAAVGNTLTVRGGLVGETGSALVINSVLGDDDSLTDKLILDGAAAGGTTSLIVVNQGGGGAETDVGILVVEAVNGATTGVDSFTLGASSRGYRAGFDTLAAGAYEYMLVRGGNGGGADNWYLVSNGMVRPEAGVYIANREAAESIFSMTMHDRLDGYEAYVDPDTGKKRLANAWARVRAGWERHSAGGVRARTRTYLIQTGVDLVHVAAGTAGAFRAGIMGGVGTARSRANNDAMSGKGDFTGYQLGVYASWFQNATLSEGLYVDSWLQHSWFRNHVRGDGLPGEKYHSTLWSASLETGYVIPLTSSPTFSWSIIPSAQAIYGKFDANNFVEAGGTEIRHAGNNNLQIRLGARLNGRLPARHGFFPEPYIEANWHHKTKNGRMYMNDDPVPVDTPRNFGEIKTGVTTQLAKGLRVGAEFFAQFGEKRYRRFGGQISLCKEW